MKGFDIMFICAYDNLSTEQVEQIKEYIKQVAPDATIGTDNNCCHLVFDEYSIIDILEGIIVDNDFDDIITDKECDEIVKYVAKEFPYKTHDLTSVYDTISSIIKEYIKNVILK